MGKMKKAYKATINMRCQSLTYEVGKEYKINKLEICKHGFHYCYRMEDVLDYYDYDPKTFVLLEVEVLGKELKDDNKVCSDHIKILRIVPPEEYNEEFKSLIPQREYDSRGNLIKEISPAGRIWEWEYEYDSYGNRTKKISPNGSVWEYEYDSCGNRTKKISPDGFVREYEYDSCGNLIKEISHNGFVWEYKYDSRGNRTKEISPNGSVWGWEYEYDSYDNRTKEISPNGSVWEYEYDSYGNLIKLISPNGYMIKITII